MAADLTRPSVWIKGLAAFWRHDKTREAIGVLAMAAAVLTLAALATFDPHDPCFFTFASMTDRQVRGHAPGFALERDARPVARQAVEIRAEKAGEAFELVERARRVERLGVEFHGGMRGVDAGMSATALLVAARMRRAVGAEKKFRIAGCRGFDERLAVQFALDDRQAAALPAPGSQSR